MTEYADIKTHLDSIGASKLIVPQPIRFNMLFYPYKFVVYNQSGEKATIGNSSFSVLKHWEYFGDSTHAIDAGNYIDCAKTCSILSGGEHFQGEVFSVGTQFLRPYGSKKPFSRGIVKIGHGVTISHGAMIRSGVSIGNGAVIGMGAVVTNDVPPFAVVAGNPARVLKYRFSPDQIENIQRSKWWELKPSYIFKNLDLVNGSRDKCTDFPKEAYGDKEVQMVFKINKSGENINGEFIGVQRDNKITPKVELPRLFQFYYDQLKLPDNEPIYVLDDLFNQG